MQISAISAPNFNGRRDNVDALIGLDDNSVRQIAYLQTESKFDNKKSKRITNAMYWAAPLAAGLGTAVFTKGKTKIFSKEVSGVAARVANGLKMTALWGAGLASLGALGFGRKKLAEQSPEVRKFDNEHPFISTIGTLAAGLGALFLVDKGAAKLASVNAPKFMQKATGKVAEFLNDAKIMVSAKNGLKSVAQKTPPALKELGGTLLSWAPSLLIIGGFFHSIGSVNAQNRDFVKNYTSLKNKQAELAQARVRELSMENDFLKTDSQNQEDVELLSNPTKGVAEAISDVEKNA